LHRARGADQARGVLAAERAVAPVEERGAQPFATGQQGGDLVDETGDLGAELGQDLALVGQVLIEGCLHALAEARHIDGVGSRHAPSLRRCPPHAAGGWTLSVGRRTFVLSNKSSRSRWRMTCRAGPGFSRSALA